MILGDELYDNLQSCSGNPVEWAIGLVDSCKSRTSTSGQKWQRTKNKSGIFSSIFYSLFVFTIFVQACLQCIKSFYHLPYSPDIKVKISWNFIDFIRITFLGSTSNFVILSIGGSITEELQYLKTFKIVCSYPATYAVGDVEPLPPLSVTSAILLGSQRLPLVSIYFTNFGNFLWTLPLN